MTGVLVFLAVIVLIIFLLQSKKTAELEASEKLAKANVELNRGDQQAAIDILLSLTDNFSGTKSAAKGVYFIAKAYYEKGEFDKSQTYFEKYLDDYAKDPILSSAAYSGLAACLEQQNKHEEAAKYYEAGADKYPESFIAVQQLMDAGRCYQNSQQFGRAKECYQKVIDNYSNSTFKSDAELYLAKLTG